MASTTPPCEDHGRDFGNGENRFASTPDDIMNTSIRERIDVKTLPFGIMNSGVFFPMRTKNFSRMLHRQNLQSMVPGVVPRKVPVVNLGSKQNPLSQNHLLERVSREFQSRFRGSFGSQELQAGTVRAPRAFAGAPSAAAPPPAWPVFCSLPVCWQKGANLDVVVIRYAVHWMSSPRAHCWPKCKCRPHCAACVQVVEPFGPICCRGWKLQLCFPQPRLGLERESEGGRPSRKWD